jgi:hypothetical protein
MIRERGPVSTPSFPGLGEQLGNGQLGWLAWPWTTRHAGLRLGGKTMTSQHGIQDRVRGVGRGRG